MKLRSTSLAAAAVLALAACADQARNPLAPPTSTAAAVSAPDDLAGRYIVTFKGNGVPKDLASRVAALGGKVESAYDALGVAVLSGLDESSSATFSSSSDIASVDADAMISLDETASVENVAEADAAVVESPAAESQLAPATAFFFARQWSYRAIFAPQAWAAGSLGSPSVRVAILDSGIDPTYPDLVGLVDPTRSTSFVPSDNALIAAFFPGRPTYTDLNAHGTHVASTVSSKAIVVAGVTSKTTLMAVKVLGANGRGAFSGIFSGIMYATDNGADVINMSLGSVFSKKQSQGFVGVLNRAVNYAHSKGVTTVVAAGNDGINLDSDGNGYAIFCSSSKVICVSATGPNRATTVNGPFFPSLDAFAVYSNYGTSAIDVAAPGGNYDPATGTIARVWQACSRTWLVQTSPTAYAKSVCAANPTAAYTLGYVGTSMASPHVAGLAALMVQQGGRNPGQIRAMIQNSADDLGAPGADPLYGKGRINAARATGAM